MVHLFHRLKHGARNIQVRIVDTDVVVLLLGKFYDIVLLYPISSIWIAIGAGKQFRYYHINTMFHRFGREKCRAIIPFDAISGCDTTSTFFEKSNKSTWKTWNIYPVVTNTFLHMVDNPFQDINLTSPQFVILQRFVVLMYDKTSVLESTNEARRQLFSKKHSIENLPSTEDALLQHITRVNYQSSIWTCSHEPTLNAPSRDGFGWKMEGTGFTHLWMTIPEAARACSELIKCGCKSETGYKNCKCMKSGQSCTDLCTCNCEL